MKKFSNSPKYPGYKSECNGCGVCCLSVPCAVSHQFNMWRKGRCIALHFDGKKYVCNVISDPKSLSRIYDFSNIPVEERLSAIGSIGKCDHRAAWSEEEAKELLDQRNLWDEITQNPNETYPRACVLHDGNGKKYFLCKADRWSLTTREEIKY